LVLGFDAAPVFGQHKLVGDAPSPLGQPSLKVSG
jgi:hypothetical protein